MRFAWALGPVLGMVALVACGDVSGPDPFPHASSGGSGGTAGSSSPGGAGGEDPGDPTLGGPCLDDEQCDDGLECTTDACDAGLERCRHSPNDSSCDDGTYCNGTEVCEPSLGCRAAAVPTCSDDDTCTIDTCVEATQSCRHEPRDADGDGDPVRACGGGDCRDDDPHVSGDAAERCANFVDDDCDGAVDEAECTEPEHDRCSDAFVVETPGAYELSLAGAAGDYAFSCAEDVGTPRDVVVAVMVPEGDPVDVDVIATVPTGNLFVAASTRCGSAAGEVACAAGVALEDAGEVARIVVRRPEPGALAVLIAATAETRALVKVAFRASEPAPENETCGTARALVPDTVERVSLAGLERDLESACRMRTGELVYYFDLEETRDVRLRAASLDDFGEPVISLRSAACRDADDELTCRSESPTELYARALPAGRYGVALAGTGPSEVELVLRTEPPSEPPDDEGCADPPAAPFGETLSISLADHVDAVRLECLVGAPDAARTLELDERSDVLLVQTGSDGDQGGVMLAEAPCTSDADRLSCRRGTSFPVRTVAYGVGPGSLRAVVEAAQGNPTTLTAFRRAASQTVLVHRADDCTNAFEIPETGGRFEGNTANAFADQGASCDYGGQPAGGAPDQLLVVTLTRPRRMVFDLFGSDYDTLLVVRDARTCPGDEVSGTCRLGSEATRSFLDVNLAAGTYIVQIDGYNGASGAWTLEVFSAEL
ncbi:MAG TPA: putative metal-binding motif-containing protein [Polyangiaceae bacterium]